MGVDITRTLVLRNDGNYVMALEGSGAFASIRETTLFETRGDHLRPLEYNYRRKVFGFGGKEQVSFDWNNNSAIYREKGSEKATHTLSANTVDPALYQLQLQIDLYQGKQTLAYEYILRKKLRNREFQIIGEDEYELQGKKYRAIVLQRVSLNDEKNTLVWVLPDLFYQTAYIQQSKNDEESYSTHLTDFSFDAKQLTKLYSSGTLSPPSSEHTAAPTLEPAP